jgi:2-methylcitrate dehydratase
VIGTPHRTLPELAAFANSVASRYLEGNDTYSGGGGHPNDNPAADSCGRAVERRQRANSDHRDRARLRGPPLSVPRVPDAQARARLCALQRGRQRRRRGKGAGLSLPQTAHAIALAAVPNLGTDISRRGHLTMWKGCAAANAARNGVFAAIMASEGMAGPPTPFEDGLTTVIGAEEICPFPVEPTTFSMLKADYKFFLSEFHAQGPAFLALKLRPQIELDDIEKIEVFTYHFAWFEIGSGAEKWKPSPARPPTTACPM